MKFCNVPNIYHWKGGISKLVRLVDVFAKRLQVQETLTAQIAETIQRMLNPLGAAVLIDASHQCMTSRGVHKPKSSTFTKRMFGVYKDNKNIRNEFMELIK